MPSAKMRKWGIEMHKNVLLENVDKIHTTEMGVGRIQRNLGIDDEPVGYCISQNSHTANTAMHFQVFLCKTFLTRMLKLYLMCGNYRKTACIDCYPAAVNDDIIILALSCNNRIFTF